MNNTLALKKITGLVNNEQNHVSEYINILTASTILKEKLCKIAVIGTRSKGKSDLINILSCTGIASNPDISIPIYISNSIRTAESIEKTNFCTNANVNAIAQPGVFYWNNSTSHKSTQKQSLDELLSFLANTKNTTGALMEFADSNHTIAQRSGIILPPDLLLEGNTEYRKKQILNAADVADIILLVATPSELNSTCFDFLYSAPGVLDGKTVIMFVIHNEISNFFHYPLAAKSNEATALESNQQQSAKGAYCTIKATYTSEDMAQMLKEGITKEAKNLVQNIEKLIKTNFSKTKLTNAYFIQTAEKPSSSDIVEDQKIIADVKSWQYKRIYQEISQEVSNAGEGKTPSVAWEYFFRKSEDVCFDTISPFYQELRSNLVNNYSRLKVIENLLTIQTDDFSVLLRDYTPIVDEKTLTQLFMDMRAKTLGLISHSKDKLQKLQAAIVENIRASAYTKISGRIKQQYKMQLPTPEAIVNAALAKAPDQDNSKQFIENIKFAVSADTIKLLWQENSPLALEKKKIQNESEKAAQELKDGIVDVLNAWIEIADLVDCKNEIEFIIKKREEILSFSPGKLF